MCSALSDNWCCCCCTHFECHTCGSQTGPSVLLERFKVNLDCITLLCHSLLRFLVFLRQLECIWVVLNITFSAAIFLKFLTPTGSSHLYQKMWKLWKSFHRSEVNFRLLTECVFPENVLSGVTWTVCCLHFLRNM